MLLLRCLGKHFLCGIKIVLVLLAARIILNTHEVLVRSRFTRLRAPSFLTGLPLL